MQNQHAKFQHDQIYFGLKRISDLFELEEDEDFTSILMTQSFNGKFKEYEISGSTKVITLEEYLDKIKPSLKRQLEELQKSASSEQKVLLKCILVFKKINNEFERFIKYYDSDGIIMRHGSDVDKVINDLYVSLLKSYEKESNQLRGSNFIFSSVDLTYLQVVKSKLKRVGTYVKTPEWIFNKNAIINPCNLDDNYSFAWAIIISMHYDEIGRNHNRMSKLKRYVNNYNWNDINFPTDKRDRDRFEKNNSNIALNIFSAHETDKQLDNIRVSKFNRTRPHKVVLLVITDGEKWHFTSVRNETRLFRGVFSKHHNDYYCFKCRQSYRTDNALKRLCLSNKDCHVKLPFKNKRIVKYEKDLRSTKSSHVIYLNYESSLKDLKDKTNINENESYQIKSNLHVPCGYGIHFVRDYDEKLLTHYRGTDCMENSVKSLKAICAMIDKTKEAPHKKLTKEQIYEYNREEKCFVCKKEVEEDNKNVKQKTIEFCYFTGEYVGTKHSYCLCNVNKLCKRVIEISICLHNGSSYDYHFIIKELPKGVDALVCVGENSEKYITFKAIINTDEIEFKLKFMDTFRFTFNSLDTLVNNLTELNKCKECKDECNNYVRINNTSKYSCDKCRKVS